QSECKSLCRLLAGDLSKSGAVGSGSDATRNVQMSYPTNIFAILEATNDDASGVRRIVFTKRLLRVPRGACQRARLCPLRSGDGALPQKRLSLLRPFWCVLGRP